MACAGRARASVLLAGEEDKREEAVVGWAGQLQCWASETFLSLSLCLSVFLFYFFCFVLARALNILDNVETFCGLTLKYSKGPLQVSTYLELFKYIYSI